MTRKTGISNCTCGGGVELVGGGVAVSISRFGPTASNRATPTMACYAGLDADTWSRHNYLDTYLALLCLLCRYHVKSRSGPKLRSICVRILGCILATRKFTTALRWIGRLNIRLCYVRMQAIVPSHGKLHTVDSMYWGLLGPSPRASGMRSEA